MLTVKKELFTSKDIKNLTELNECQFTGEEYRELAASGFLHVPKYKEEAIAIYLRKNYLKLCSLDFLAEYLKNNSHYKNLISFGAGHCVLEYMLSIYMGKKINIYATDLNDFFIENAEKFAPHISCHVFDFKKDPLSNLLDKTGVSFDIGIAFGSFYVMDDEIFIKVLKSFRESGLKEIIDFHSGYLHFLQMLTEISFLGKLRNVKMIRRIFGKNTHSFQRKIHGYARNKQFLREIYKKSGWQIVKEFNDKAYNYIAILQ